MPTRNVLVTVPNDFREPPRLRFRDAQWADARDFAEAVRRLGYNPVLVEEDLINPNDAYRAVSDAVRMHIPCAVVKRSYLWADPPNGHAATLATPIDVPLAASAYTAPLGAKLGEAPGEVFMLHTTCADRMCGRRSTRLIGPLSGDRSDQTMEDLRSFLAGDGVHVPTTSGSAVSEVLGNPSDIEVAAAGAILASLRGKVVAMTGGHCMGMLPNGIQPVWHCGTGTRGWGLNIPIISPDLYLWYTRVQDNYSKYIGLGGQYLDWLKAQGVRFCYGTDAYGNDLGDDERDYDDDTAAYQLAYYAAMVEICQEHGIDLLGIPAQLVMTESLFCGDLIKGVANSSQGPEGRSEPLFWLTEGDIDAALSHYVLYGATRHAPAFADVRCTIPDLGPDTWMMCNSGAACADIADGGFAGCYSVRQYKGYFAAGGGTFAFGNAKPCHVVGLRIAHDQDGPYGTVAIGRTVQSSDPAHYVDDRWPQLRVEVYAPAREAYHAWPTNHFHWAESVDPLVDARTMVEVLACVAGLDRVTLLYDGRQII